MAIQIRAVRLQASASNTTQDYTVSGFGTVQAAIVIAGMAGSGSDVAPMRQSFGFWDTTNSVGWFNYYEDAALIASAGTRSGQSNSNILEMLTGGVGTERSATISAVTDGIRLTWAGSDTSIQPYVIVILINGINGAQAGAATPNATDAGTQQETTTGLTPKVIFAGQNRGNVADADIPWATASFGFAYDNGVTIDQKSIAWNHISGASQVNTMVSSNRISSNMGSASTDTQQEITAMASGSFTQTTRDVDATGAADSDLYYLALDFDDGAEIQSYSWPITTGDFTPYTGGSITPSAAIHLSAYTNNLDARQSGAEAGFFGVYVSTESEEFQLGWAMEDGADPNSNVSGRTETALFTQTDVAGTPDALASNPSYGSGVITYADANVDEASIASVGSVLVFEGAASGSIAPIIHHRKMLGIQ